MIPVLLWWAAGVLWQGAGVAWWVLTQVAGAAKLVTLVAWLGRLAAGVTRSRDREGVSP